MKLRIESEVGNSISRYLWMGDISFGPFQKFSGLNRQLSAIPVRLLFMILRIPKA